MNKFFLALAVATAAVASAADAAITYVGSVTDANSVAAGTQSADYSITTDGTLGTLAPTNFIGYTLSINNNGNFINSSGSGVYSGIGSGSGATATATTLSFDFGNPVNSLVFFDEESFLCFLSASDGCAGAPSIAFGFAPTALFAYSFRPASVLVIGTVASGAAPEPASWAMLIAGFGLTGAAMRRRKATVLA